MKSFKPEVCASADGSFSQNSLAFGTKAEAEKSAHDLFLRWTLCTAWRAVESDQEVNYELDLETGVLTPVSHPVEVA